MPISAHPAENDFLNSVQPISYIRGYIPNDSLFHNYNGNGFLLKSEYNGWLFIGEGSGIVFKFNDGSWKKIDETYFRGYDFGSYPFISGGIEIYKYGGYGFWKTNGILSYFDYKKKEWEIINMSREIPAMNRYCFYDMETKQFFLLGSFLFNQTTNTSEYTDSLYVLNLDSHKWKTLGKISSELENINPAKYFEPTGLTIPSANGFIFISEKSQPFLVDFKTMTHCSFSPKANAVLKILFEKASDKSVFLVAQKDRISLYDRNSLQETFHVQWTQITSNLITNSLLESKVFKTNKNNTILTIVGYLLIGILGFIVIFKLKHRRRKKLAAGLLILSNGDLTLNEKNTSEFLTREEYLVFKTIAESTLVNLPVTTHRINEILQIENRTLDGQKNYRSEVIKSINQKLRINGLLDFDVILRERSSEDKRMMTYSCLLKVKKD